MAGIAAAVAAVAVVVPIVGDNQPESAATILLDAAAKASQHGVLSPGPNQALQDNYNIAIDATQNDSSGSVVATATFRGTIEEWTLSDGTGHEQISYGMPQFSSPADAHAWVYGHGIPFQGTIPYTSKEAVFSLGPAIGVIDVKSLPTDPLQLSSMLAQPRTGVSGLDQINGPDPLFERVALLLSTPLLGSSPAFESALYQVLAGLPGIEALGTMTDHRGRSGEAFTQKGAAITLIVDTSTGSLLEMLEHRAPASSPTSGGPAVGTESLLWLDPAGERVIPSNSVPGETSN
jgi:hypothetical protein